MAPRWVAPALAAAMLAFTTPAQAAAPWTASDTLDALDGSSALVRCIVTRETGGTFDPYSVGAQGELGPVQLHPRGLLRDFQYGEWTVAAPSIRDPFDPYQSVSYLESALARGMGSNWSTWAGCL